MAILWLESLKRRLGIQSRPYRFHIPEKKKEYVIRVNNPDGRSPYLSQVAFHYPTTGYVEMPGYKPGLSLSNHRKKDDGMGLFGLWRGMGQPLTMLQYAEANSVYCLIEVRYDEMEIIDKGREVKFPRGNVLYSGGFSEIMGHLYRLATRKEHITALKNLQFYYDIFVECGYDRNVFFPELKRRGLNYNHVRMGIHIADFGQRWVRDENGCLYLDIFHGFSDGFVPTYN